MAQILVIDDDSSIQLLLKRALTYSGHNVSLASDGAEGLKMAIQLCPDLIICDWLMPKMNGLEVCRHIKSRSELSTTFLILVTSLGSVDDRVKGLDAGADDFLCKPIEINELQARVRAGLRLHQLSYDLQQQKQLLEAELAEAADYVRSILPAPVQESTLKIDFRFFPSRQLGGDGFDYYWLDQDHLAIYLLDVSGHGLRSALPSLSVINLLRSQGLNQVNYSCPSEVLGGLNRTFQITPRNDKYFTIWYGVYCRKNAQLTYSSAGHPPAVLLSNQSGEITEKRLKTTGFPIGMFEEAEYVDHTCSINPDSSLYIFSDGIYEIEQTNGKIFGLENFISLLKTYYQKSPNNLEELMQKVHNLHQVSHLDDDLSIMQINFD
ncbi:regulator [Aphanothece hegewaldii CCALA 016]|uniref:Regulator n=1 Tax=Aphanothece hegewaldii CCALA 016 TaxID=2107694 RepID=A0A2T1LYT7_9CHRO|nr:SpoIIE family protein phosphatase [Aphanothece hegewaldii]PSF37531.1 regulator [Aphanothece hegewaldii CCALA 016]